MISFDSITFQWEEVENTTRRRLVVFIKDMPVVPDDERHLVELEMKQQIKQVMKIYNQ